MGDFASNVLARTYSYDRQRNFHDTTVVVDRNARKTTTTYNPPGSGLNSVTVNINGLITSTTDSAGNTVSYEYDNIGRIEAEIDPRLSAANATLYSYKNNSSLLESVTETSGQSTVLTYDSAGHAIRTDRLDNAGGVFPIQTTNLRYDKAGRTTHTWGNGAIPVEYAYNDLGQRTKMYTFRNEPSFNGTDFTTTGDETTWTYHSSTGVLASKRDAANQTHTYTYDDLGRVSYRVDARGVGTSYYYYDSQYGGSKEFTGQLRQQSYNVSGTSAVTTPTRSYKYHRNGGLREVTDFTGTRTFDYFEYGDSGNANRAKSGLLKKENMPGFYLGHHTEYDYHFDVSNQINGMPKTVLARDDGALVYQVETYYSNRNRVSSVKPKHHSETSFGYSYVANSNLVDKITRYGYTRDYDYMSDSNRLSKVRTDWNNANVSDASCTWDAFGRLDVMEISGNVVTGLGVGDYGNYGLKEYQKYTDRNRIDYSVKHQLGANGSWGPGVKRNGVSDNYREYDFDPIGNRIKEVEHQTVFNTSRNNLNQYTAYGSASHAYDANGNLTSDGKRTYKYDAENQLSEVIPTNPASGDLKILNKYDYMGRRGLKRVWEWTGSWTLRQDLTSRFLYDGWNLIAEIGHTNAIKKQYTWGTDVSGTSQGAGGVGGLLMIEIKEGSGFKQLYPIYDQSHNIRGLQDSSGSIVARYDYDTFGETFKANGDSSNYNGENNYAEANPFRYSTKYTDNFSTNYPSKTEGLVYYGLRFYVPETGRFLNRDPIQEAGGINLYGFVGNNPVNGYDLLGMERNPFVAEDSVFTSSTVYVNPTSSTMNSPTHSDGTPLETNGFGKIRLDPDWEYNNRALWDDANAHNLQVSHMNAFSDYNLINLSESLRNNEISSMARREQQLGGANVQGPLLPEGDWRASSVGNEDRFQSRQEGSVYLNPDESYKFLFDPPGYKDVGLLAASGATTAIEVTGPYGLPVVGSFIFSVEAASLMEKAQKAPIAKKYYDTGGKEGVYYNYRTIVPPPSMGGGLLPIIVFEVHQQKDDKYIGSIMY